MIPGRGEIWWASLDPTQGREQSGRRPVLILSVGAYNSGPADLAVVVPLTSTVRQVAYHVPVLPPEGGLTVPSSILCDALRSISKSRLGSRMGVLPGERMSEVELRIRTILGL